VNYFKKSNLYFVEFIRFNTQTGKIELGVKPTPDSSAAVKYLESFVLNDTLTTIQTEAPKEAPKAKLKPKKVSK
jgi:hypothetical protein